MTKIKKIRNYINIFTRNQEERNVIYKTAILRISLKISETFGKKQADNHSVEEAL